MVSNALTILASALKLVKRTRLKWFLVEVVAAPSILDNINKFQVFQNDQHILKFIMCNGKFKGKEIDDTLDDKLEDDELEDEDGILNLKSNTIPKGMVELEHIFYHDEVALNKRMVKECNSYNLCTDEDPKMVRVGKLCNT